MPTNAQQLSFAIKAVNEAERALKEVQANMGELEGGVEGVERAFQQLETSSEGGLQGLNAGLLNAAAAGDVAERALIGVADLAGFMSDQIGLNLGPLEEWSRGLADVGGAAGALLPLADDAWNKITGMLAPVMAATTSTWSYVTSLYAQAAAFIAANAPMLIIIGSLALVVAGVILAIKYWDEIVEAVPFLGPAVEKVRDVVEGAMRAVTGAFSSVLDFVRNHWQTIATLISGPFAPLVFLATDAFGVRTALVDAFTAMWTSVSGWATNTVSLFTNLPGQLKSAFGAGFDFLWDMFKIPVNKIIQAWNNLDFTIGGGSAFGVSFPSVTFGTPNIPMLAAGTRGFPGGWALVGEQGPELARLPRGTDVFSAGETRTMLDSFRPGSGETVIVNNHFHVAGSIVTMQELAYELRRLGAVV